MVNPTAAMLVIGDEILSGRTLDTNTQTLAKTLTELGIDLCEGRVVADDQAAIVRAINALRDRYVYVFTSGGIGPTHDDITADAVAFAFGVAIDIRDDARALLQTHYAREGIELNEARLRMARIPDGATLIANPISSAPGFILENVHVLAGVPAIFQAMLADVAPQLETGVLMLSRSFRADAPEGEIAKPLGVLAQQYPDLSIGSYPFRDGSHYGTNLVMRGRDSDALDAASAELCRLIPEAIAQ